MNTSSPDSDNANDIQLITPIDILTVSAIAILCYLIGVIVHEALGHGLMAVIFGFHVTRVTSVDLEVNYLGGTDWKVRTIAAAGCTANVVVALITISIAHLVKRGTEATRYFLWMLATINIFLPGGYLMALSFAGFGDWNAFVQGLSFMLAWRIGLTILGVVISVLGLVWAVRNLDPFLGGSRRQRYRRARSLTLIPYLVGSTVETLASALNPTSPLLILSSAAAATFGGTIFLLWINAFVGRAHSTTLDVPLTPTRDWLWISLGCVAFVIYFVVLGPGLPR